MGTPQVCLIIPLGDQGLGIWGGPPLYPDQGLPGGQPHPSHPIYHPGHPDHGKPSHPIAGGGDTHPSHPINIPGVPDQGLPPGESIPPDEVSPPGLPEGHEDDLVIAVRSPGGEWKYTAYDVQPDQGQPQPTPQSRRHR
jgi:hypothetical protein